MVIDKASEARDLNFSAHPCFKISANNCRVNWYLIAYSLLGGESFDLVDGLFLDGVARVVLALSPLAVLQRKTADDNATEDHEEGDQGAEATPVACAVKAIELHDLIDCWRVDAAELGHHHGLESIPDWREVHEPGHRALRRLLEDAREGDHVATEQVERHVDDRCERDSRRRVVERAGKCVAHGGCRLNHEHEDEVERDELREGVIQADGEVGEGEEDEWDNEHDRNLSNELGRGVHPDVIHAGVPLSHIDGLLSLEYNNSWLEIEEHLHDCHEVDGAGHIADARWVVVVVDLPEGTHHQKGYDGGLNDLGPGEARLPLSQSPAPVHELRKLYSHGCFVVNSVGS